MKTSLKLQRSSFIDYVFCLTRALELIMQCRAARTSLRYVLNVENVGIQLVGTGNCREIMGALLAEELCGERPGMGNMSLLLCTKTMQFNER